VAGETVEARVVSRAALRPGDEVQGPALIEQSDTTTLLASDERAVVDDALNLVVHLS
jgi:N-methylhydantoinase A